MLLDDAFLVDASAEKLQAIAACRTAIADRRQNRGCRATP